MTACKEIREIDSIVGELRTMQMNLPEQVKKAVVDAGKEENQRTVSLLAMVFGVLGFEWVSDNNNVHKL